MNSALLVTVLPAPGAFAGTVTLGFTMQNNVPPADPSPRRQQ
jgi:hypothetical protein